MKQLNMLFAGQIFRFASNGLKYGVSDLDGNFKYRTCNKKFFKYIGHGQFVGMELNERGRFAEVDNTLFNCYITGRGENKKLYYENVIIIDL